MLIIEYAKKLKDMGAVNVLISMAGDGAVLVDEYGNVHTCNACKGQVKNSVGAGDSMVAGFIAGAESGDYEYALKLGTAAGGATAFSNGLAGRRRPGAVVLFLRSSYIYFIILKKVVLLGLVVGSVSLRHVLSRVA